MSDIEYFWQQKAKHGKPHYQLKQGRTDDQDEFPGRKTKKQDSFRASGVHIALTSSHCSTTSTTIMTKTISSLTQEVLTL